MSNFKIYENKARKGRKETIIDIEGYIGFDPWKSYKNDDEKQNTKERIKKQLKEIGAIKADDVVVNINSYGGDVNHGISIHDLLAENPANVITKINGMTASAATIIAQAGSVRRMSDNALFLPHAASTFGWGNAVELAAVIDDLKRVDQRIINIYSKRSGKSNEEVFEVMDQGNHKGVWLSAEEALEFGFIDEIFEPTAMVASFIQNFNSDMNAKDALPPLPEGYAEKISKFTEQKNNSNKVDDNLNNNTNEESSEMDTKSFIEMKDMFGADKAAEYLENDVSIEDAKTDFINVIKAENLELTTANDVAATENVEAKATIVTLEAKVKALNEGADPIPGKHSNAAIDEEIENDGEDDEDTFADKVDKIVEAKGCTRGEATSMAVDEYPELHEAYTNPK